MSQTRLTFSHDPVRRADRFPAGAVAAGTPVEVVLRIEEPLEGAEPRAWIEVLDGPGLDGEAPRWRRKLMEPCEAGFKAVIGTEGAPRVLFYRFRIRVGCQEMAFGARGDGLATMGQLVLLRGEPGAPCDVPGFQLTVHQPGFEAPAWFSGSVMYQIFPDRFARGKAGVRREGIDAHQRHGWPVRVHEDWNEAPDWIEPYEPVDFFGGTLAGIEEHLDYLASLGVGVLYLNPVCEARSNHRYNTGDYEAVDPILGTWDDFSSLAQAAEERGMRIVLDTVLSHTGAASRYFNADRSYDSFGAAQGPDSPYRTWYDFRPASDNVPYRCWWGDLTLPETNEWEPSWQRYMLGVGEEGGGVLGCWLGRGAGGLRLDVADEIPDNVLEAVRTSVKGSDPEAVIIGEVWEDATTKESYGSRRTYALGAALDSVMNYPLRDALVRYALGYAHGCELATFLKRQKLNYPEPFYKSLMNLLSSHDVERIRSVLSLGREIRGLSRSDQAACVASIDGSADYRGASLQRVLAALIYALPGVPCIYYGDERGMQGGRDPFDRATFPWDGPRADCGEDLTAFYQALGQLRASRAVLREGEAAFYSAGADVAAVLRVSKDAKPVPEAVLLVANRSDETRHVAIDLVAESAGLAPEDACVVREQCRNPRLLFATQEWRVDQSVEPRCEDGIFSCAIGPQQACLFELGPGLAEPLGRGAGVVCHITSLPAPGESKASEALAVPAAPETGEEDAKAPVTEGTIEGALEEVAETAAEGAQDEAVEVSAASAPLGTFGEAARRFVDQLAAQGARYWQILPLNPTDEFGSPYAGISAFAGNVTLLDPEEPLPQVNPLTWENGQVVAQSGASCGRRGMLAQQPFSARNLAASRAAQPSAAPAEQAAFEVFARRNSSWLLPYAVFYAVKAYLGEIPWTQWPEPYKHYEPSLALRPELAPFVHEACVLQFAFDRQWRALRSYANSRGVRIIGDIPIYVSADSADVWANPGYFALNEDGTVALQGGVPPDAFAVDGQLWGNPTYNWDVLRENGFDWWIARFERMFEWYDYVRVDHFIGLVNYYAIPAGCTAADGEWLSGPGIELFERAFEAHGPLPVIAEDLGIVTPAVKQLLARTGMLGMDVIQFADGDPRTNWRPAWGKMCYTATHDTPTLKGWAASRYGESEAQAVAEELKAKAAASSAGIVMLPLQDVLGLDDTARMNVPGTTGGNWCWRANEAQVNERISALRPFTRPRRRQ